MKITLCRGFNWKGVLDYLHKEHGLGGDFHVVAELEVSKEGDGLRHAHVAVYFEAHVGNGLPRHYQTHNVFRYHVQSRRL